MKRLLAAGGEAIYQITRAFRREEHGRLHNPEFTMVEWYRVGDGLAEGMQLLSDLGEAMLGRGAAKLLTHREAFERHVGLDPHAADADALIRAARDAGIDAPASLSKTDRDGWLDLLLVALRAAATGPRASDDLVRLSGQPGGVGPSASGIAAGRRAIRACTSRASSWPTAITS